MAAPRPIPRLQPPEREWQAHVMALARRHGWALWHFHDSRREVRRGGARFVVGDRDAAGFPDLVLAHTAHGIVFAELKAPKGRLTDLQRRSLDAIASACTTAASRGVLVHVWRPADLDDVVAPVLAGTWHGDRFHGW